MISMISDAFNDREVNIIKRMVLEQEKRERKNNIVIKGVKIEGRVGKEWVQNFIKEKIRVETKILDCRKSETVIIAKIENEEKKREIMYNKNRLRGERIYIEHDLVWEERKRQEKIGKRAKKREKGKDVKVGFGRVMMNRVWRK